MGRDSEINLALRNVRLLGDSAHSANLIHISSVKGLRLYTSSLDCRIGFNNAKDIVGGY